MDDADPAYGAMTQVSPLTPVPLMLSVLDIPALTSDHMRKPGVYIAVARHDTGKPWTQGYVFMGDDPDRLTCLSRVSVESTMGSVAAFGGGIYGLWDYVTQITVTLLSGSLESLTEADVLVGGNLAVVGDEIIAYQNADLQVDGTYILSNLLRGLRDTTISAHSDDERFIPLSVNNVRFIELDAFNIGATRYFKAVSGGGDASTVASQSFAIQAINLRPFAPCNLEATVDGGYMTVTWNRRTRDLVRLFQPSLIAEESLMFDVELWESGILTLAWTVTSEDTTFTAPAGAATIKVFQKSAQFGRGNPGILEIT